MAFARKQDHLLKLKPDVAVIPECESDIGAAAGCWSWVGDKMNPRKGLGVVSYGDYLVSRISPVHDLSLRWIAPIAVTGPHAFFLLAIWAHRPYLAAYTKLWRRTDTTSQSGPRLLRETSITSTAATSI